MLRSVTGIALMSVGAVLLCAPASGWNESELARQVRGLEMNGDVRGARQMLQRALRSNPRDAATLALWAAFLDQRRDPGAREAYEQFLALPALNPDLRRDAGRRLALLELIAGDRQAAERRLANLPSPPVLPSASEAGSGLPMKPIYIPGPMRGFSRMAALSPDLLPNDVMGALTRNVVMNGYHAVGGSESLEQTEYLKLVLRYLSQARELEKFAGESRQIHLPECDSAQTGELLKILGFRMRGGCGADVVLETVNASRAFLSMDSGFPLAQLEEALRTNRPFSHDWSPTQIPVLYGPEYWLSARERFTGETIDAFLGDPSLCRLYLGLVKLDPETAEQVRQHMPVQRVRAFAHVFDFFGGMFQLRNGRVVAPGGERSAAAWADLVGSHPNEGVVFVEKLVTKDDGWMASYFDALSRISGPAVDYLTEPNRMKRFYTALRGRITSPGPARPVFRANTDLMLLTTRIHVLSDGRPHIPGGIDVWKQLFIKHPHGKYDGKLTRAASGWSQPDDVVEALFALSRKAVENEPLKIFLTLTDIDRRRERPLESATVDRLAREFRAYGAQYSLFTEAPSLSDATILQFMDAASAVSSIRNNVMKADAAGTMQALTGLWQVFVRQGLLPAAQADAVLAGLVEPFTTRIRNDQDLFDAGRDGVFALLKATGAPAEVNPHDRMIDLLAGAPDARDEESLGLLRTQMLRVFEAQRLVSLKVIFDLSEHLESLSRGEKLNTALLNRLASRVSDLNLPKASLTTTEKNSFSFGYWTERHLDAQRKLNFRAVIDRAGGNAEKLREARGLLAPLLRDTLVGLLYIHYAPPGAQILYTNSLFARSHDFIGIQGTQQTWKSTEVLGTGWPSSAGGRLVGSLSTLPYALAEAEQNFLIPSREQALIWGDLVPQMLVSAKLPRWWRVTPGQTHWVGLHLRLGEAALAEAALSPAIRTDVLGLLDRFAQPARWKRVAAHLEQAQVAQAIEQVTPSEFYHLGALVIEKQLDVPGGLHAKIAELANADPERHNHAAISAAFGTPKPTLANSLRPQLLNLRTFPTLMGYSSRILAETWESSNLFYAALSDELGYRPSQLNLLIPEWTQRTVEQIFATHLEDWPALLRSMHVIAGQIRTETRKSQALEEQASLE
ncbi:MAG: hypothetical protein KJZ84_08725 [Bryobacteraceae bacterium]|nr:hypothetical protein [Bryobacteraceae bacterium]